MYDYFNRDFGVTYGEHVPAIWPQLRKNVASQLNAIKLYYRLSNYAVGSSHFLVRLLQSISVSKNLSTERYYDNVKAMAGNFSMAMQMTSSLYKGKTFSGVFYPPGSEEVLISLSDDVNYEHVHRNWQEVSAVKFLRHHRSDLNMSPLDYNAVSTETGIAVVTICIPTLALQYRAFSQRELYKMQTIAGYSPRSIQQFVFSTVLANAFESHFEVAMFNRLLKHFKEEEPGTVAKKPAIGLADYTPRIDYVLNKIKHGVTVHTKSVDEYLTYLPQLRVDSARDYFVFPDEPPTRQITWALNYAAEPLLQVYLAASRGKGYNSNGALITKVDKLRRSLKSDKALFTTLTHEQYNAYTATLDSFLAMSR